MDSDPPSLPLTTEERELLAELIAREEDPLRLAVEALTPGQRGWFDSLLPIKVLEGGNRSGKTWTAAALFLCGALGIWPEKPLTPRESTHVGPLPGGEGEWQAHWDSWVGWWCTASYALFSEQTWKHFKRLLLWPGETIEALPTRRVLSVGWDSRSPEVPTYLKLRRPDGRIAEIYIKSYEQGREKFQSSGPNWLHLDEECTKEVYDEVIVRRPDRGARLTLSMIAYNGAEYLKDLEEQSQLPNPHVYHARLAMWDNPSLDKATVEDLKRQYANNPELFRLRMQGFAIAREGLVYKDHIFTKEHVCDPFELDATWTRYFGADHGWRHSVGLWFAVSPPNKETGKSKIRLYREHHGQERTPFENGAAFRDMSQGETILDPMIDRATHAATGTLRDENGKALRVIDAYNKATGWSFSPSLQATVWSGIIAVWGLLGERDENNEPLFQVFRTCTYFLEERRKYRSPDVTGEGDDPNTPEKPDNPVKKHDHAMDAWRYRVVKGMRWREGAGRAPAPGSLGAQMLERRRPVRGARL